MTTECNDWLAHAVADLQFFDLTKALGSLVVPLTVQCSWKVSLDVGAAVPFTMHVARRVCGKQRSSIGAPILGTVELLPWGLPPDADRAARRRCSRSNQAATASNNTVAAGVP